MNEMVIVKSPVSNASCYVSHYVSEVLERRSGEVKVLRPTSLLGLTKPEPVWVPADRCLPV